MIEIDPSIEMAANKCALLFLLFLGGLVSVVRSSSLPEMCSKVLADDDQLVDYCANDFLKGKEAEFADKGNWKKIGAAAISQGVARAVAIQETVSGMAEDKSLPLYQRAMASICLQFVKRGADQLSTAAEEFNSVAKVTDDEMRQVQIKVDDGRVSQGKCEELLEGQATLASLKDQVHKAFVGSEIVSKFLFHVRAN